MTFIDISEASKATGKNQMTIRRLVKKPASKPFIRLEKSEFGDKYTIDVNYLFSQYPPINNPTQKPLNNDNTLPIHGETIQSIQAFLERLLREKDERIHDLKEQLDRKEDQLDRKDKIIEQLTETIKLLPAPAAAPPVSYKKSSSVWWKRILGKGYVPFFLFHL